MSDDKRDRERRQADAGARTPAKAPAAPRDADQSATKQDGLMNRGGDPAEGQRR